MEPKKCTCKEPLINQQLPAGFKGTIVCARCQGGFEYPRAVRKYEGTDEIEAFIFDLDANSRGMTLEKAVLKMLLRIEKAINRAAMPAQNKKL